MKIRQGFVSNSSSSSFIVPFPKNVEINPLTVHQYLYGTEPTSINPGYSTSVSSMSASKVISDAMKNQTPNDPVAIDEAADGHIPGQPEWDYKIRYETVGDAEWSRLFALYEKSLSEYRDKLVQEYKAQWGDDVDLYVFSFSDEDGSFWATLEHGGTFDNVPHLAVSHH